MSLFQKSVLNKYLKAQEEHKIVAAFEKLKVYQAKEKSISEYKEEEYQDGFLRDVFVNVLGYTYKYDGNDTFNLLREKKNVSDSKKADGAILKEGEVFCVIELKDTTTKDLTKVETQAFGYQSGHTNCKYVIISNFEKLNFYIKNKVDNIEFNLFTATLEEFKTIYLCLHADNLLTDIPLKVKEASLVEDEKVTKGLYKDYSAFKNALWENLCDNHPEEDKLFLFKKTQKLLDRFLFIFFGEDKGLLPPNSISEIIKQWEQLKELDEYKPLYERFVKYFGYLNTGWKGKQHEIFAYNGGLFLPDVLLDKVKIDDDVLHPYVMKLTAYDFESDVDVNILGHIFEHSLNEIESITAELEGKEVDKGKTKRKKDGVFYTPKYITKYIVENTVGKLCAEKKEELDIVDEEYAKGRKNRKKETIKTLDKNLQAYRNWLLQITICDPACGSGAFLNQALEFLMQEHKNIDELESQLLGHSFEFPGVENHILENNLFGVDINDESVEIAKLSLWLRTAQKGRKLTSLNNNIKCGNSLIDDVAVAGEKAFSWEKEFAAVFAKGGFDVVIGNPPYVDIKALDSEMVKALFKYYRTTENRINLYSIFIEKAYDIVKENGFVSFINPNSVLVNSSYKKIRTLLIDEMSKIIKLPDNVFVDAKVETIIFEFRKKNISKTVDVLVYPKSEKIEFLDNSRISRINKSVWKKDVSLNYNIFLSIDDINLLNKIRQSSTDELGSFSDFCLGITPYDKYQGHSPETIKTRAFHSLTKLDLTYKPLITGSNILRFNVKNESEEYIKYGDWLGAKREERFFTSPRIIVRQIVSGRPPKIYAGYTEEALYFTQIGFSIIPHDKNSIKYILSLLNSKLITYYHKYQYLDIEKDLFQKILIANCKKLPFKIIPELEQQPFANKVDAILELNNKLQNVSTKFISLLQSELSIEKLTKKIEKWHSLEWSDFEKELKRIKITLTGEQKEDWFERFNRLKTEAQTLKAEINKKDAEIDAMVYELYDLNKEEIKIVEGS